MADSSKTNDKGGRKAAKEENKETLTGGAEKNLNRVYSTKNDADIEQVRYDGNPPVPPRKPGFPRRLFDKALRTFGGSLLTRDRWNEYEKERDMGSENQAVKAENRQAAPRENSVREPSVEELRNANYDAHMKKLSGYALSQDALVCGDPKELDRMMNEKNCTPAEKTVLGFRRDTANKIEALGQNAQRPVCPEIQTQGNNIYLSGARQPVKQSTANGCWSVSLESLLAYHGVNLSQQEIRAYRPDCSIDPTRRMPEEKQENERRLLSKRMNEDTVNDICDYSDLVHTTMQDVALHHVAPNFANGTDELKHYVRMGLEEHKSPISMCLNGHFRTIVGIEGDTLLVLDPQKEYPEVDGKIQPSPLKLSSIKVSDHSLTLDWIEKLDDKTKDAAIDSIKGVENGETFSRRKGFTKEVYDQVSPDIDAITEHHIVYPKAYEQEALRRVKEDMGKAKAPEQIKETKSALEWQSSEPGLSRKEAEIKFREVKKAFLATKNEIEKDKQASQAKQKARAAERENSTKMVTKKGAEAFKALVESAKPKQNIGATTAPKTVYRSIPEKAQEPTKQTAAHKPGPKAKAGGMSK